VVLAGFSSLWPIRLSSSVCLAGFCLKAILNTLPHGPPQHACFFYQGKPKGQQLESANRMKAGIIGGHFKVYSPVVFFFNWRIIALQCSVGFCHTSTWINHRYTYAPSLLNLPPTLQHILPLWVVTEHQLELPASYNKFPLAIYFTYGNVYMFQCYSRNLSHSLLPRLCPQVCFLCLCLYCWPTNRSRAIFLDSTYMC